MDQARAHTVHWRRWGPYLSERQWGTVREDYSADGSCLGILPARPRALACLSLGRGWTCSEFPTTTSGSVLRWRSGTARIRFLKERLFGLTNGEGNHGEDVKEYYYYLDNTPTHSYMKALYKYPQAEFPYRRLIEENRRRPRNDAGV